MIRQNLSKPRPRLGDGKEDAVEQTRYVDTLKSEKQEQFAQLIAGGMSKAEAYREAYNAENMADERFGLKPQSWQITVRLRKDCRDSEAIQTG